MVNIYCRSWKKWKGQENQICEVAGIGQLVEVNDAILGILVHEEANDMGSDEACATCNHYISFEFHNH